MDDAEVTVIGHTDSKYPTITGKQISEETNKLIRS